MWRRWKEEKVVEEEDMEEVKMGGVGGGGHRRMADKCYSTWVYLVRPITKRI